MKREQIILYSAIQFPHPFQIGIEKQFVCKQIIC